ncbi:unnamed protein product [Brassica rapa subsp. narinosa]
MVRRGRHGCSRRLGWFSSGLRFSDRFVNLSFVQKCRRMSYISNSPGLDLYDGSLSVCVGGWYSLLHLGVSSRSCLPLSWTSVFDYTMACVVLSFLAVSGDVSRRCV